MAAGQRPGDSDRYHLFVKPGGRAARRISGGSSMAEFGPALGVVLLCLFFPMMDVLALGLSYGLCMVLNYNQVHEASLIDSADATSSDGPIFQEIPDKWANGMGHFVKLTSPPQTDVSYRDGEANANGDADKIVAVQTTVVCSPFVPIPLPIVNIPGVNGPVTFVICSERPMENPDYAGAVGSIASSGAAAPVATVMAFQSPAPQTAAMSAAPPVPSGGGASPAGPGGPSGPASPVGANGPADAAGPRGSTGPGSSS